MEYPKGLGPEYIGEGEDADVVRKLYRLHHEGCRTAYSTCWIMVALSVLMLARIIFFFITKK